MALGQEVRLPSLELGWSYTSSQTPRALRAPHDWTWGEVNDTTQIMRGLLSVIKQPSADDDIPLSLKSFPCLPPSPHLPQLTVSWSPGGQAKSPNIQHFRGNLSSRIQGTLILRRISGELPGLAFNQGDSQTSHTAVPMPFTVERTERKHSLDPGEGDRYKLQDASTGSHKGHLSAPSKGSENTSETPSPGKLSPRCQSVY